MQNDHPTYKERYLRVRPFSIDSKAGSQNLYDGVWRRFFHATNQWFSFPTL